MRPDGHLLRRGATSRLAGFAAVSLLSLLLCAASAFGATVRDRPLLFSFDGSDSTAGKFNFPVSIAIDEPAGSVYVSESQNIDKFNSNGEAKNFPSTGTSSLLTQYSVSQIAVDNSLANPGRIYTLTSAHDIITAYSPTGTGALLWELQPSSCDIAVDSAGHLWASGINNVANHTIREYANTGSPPSQIGEVETSSEDKKTPCALAIDAASNLYVDTGPVDKYVGGVFDSTLDPFSPNGIATDQVNANGHVFVAHSGNFSEYDSSGAKVGTFGEGMNGGGNIGSAESDIAYDASLDRVYVLYKGFETSKVFAFGPLQSLGTAPDLTINPTTSGSIETAHLSGTINPLGLENSYHFEYKGDNQAAWVSGVTSTPTEQIAPSDSAIHDVSFDLTGLKPFTQYQVRLVATNDETGIENVSPVDFFRTGQFAVATIGTPTAIAAHTAQINGTVDPKDTETTWRFQTSISPECLAGKGFSDRPSQTIEANAGATAVEEELSGLIPSQDYCVRIAATNSPGTVFSEIKKFTTATIKPSAEGRGAAPRTETGARLNALLNPENAATTYHFEYSADGGATWSALPNHLLPAGTATQVLVSDELTGLKPDTTYSFRLFAEDAAGAVQSEAQPFTTVAEPPQSCANEDVRDAQHTAYLGSCRGIELVNNPDKGNQNAWATPPVGVGASPMSADGEKVVWYVLGGAPGGPNGSQSSFLANRAADGWHSSSVSPPAEEQLGGGDFLYNLIGSTPGFDAFAIEAKLSSGLAEPPPPIGLVRVRANGQQDVLSESDVAVGYNTYPKLIDMSDDGEHVLAVNPATRQLEDLGSARVGPPAVPGEVLSIMPGGSPSECGLGLDGSSFGAAPRPGYHWIATTDALRVYFQVAADGDCKGPVGLYVRDRETGETTLIDAGGGTEFIRATPDGRHAYFVTTSNLDPADANGHSDVYRWDEEAGKSSCLTCVAPGGAQLAGPVPVSVMVSDDFSHIYFISGAQVLPGKGGQGKVNLYVLSGGQLHFIGVVGPSTQNLTSILNREVQPGLSHDGNMLLLGATATPELSTDATAAQCIRRAAELGACEELYRYDDRDRSLECLSCKHDGTTTHSFGSATATSGVHFKLSGDGATAAFATAESLLSSDVNSDTDIYEWRNGALHLITDGVTDFQAGLSAPQVLAVDGDGSDILFRLVPPRGRLTGYERDGVLNLYDAREGGGFPPPSPLVHCEGDACQGLLQAPPAARNPSSSGYAGRGNAHAALPSCRRSKVRRHGRCVKRHKRSHKRTSHAKQGRSR